MKVFAAMFIAATMVTFVSCGKDYEKEIIGSWELTGGTSVQTVSGLTGQYASYNGTRTEDLTPKNGESYVITFNEGGSMTMTMIEGGRSETQSGTWSIKDDQLTITVAGDSDGPQTMTITEFEDDKVTLQHHSVNSRSDMGLSYTVEETTTMIFKRK